MRYRDRLHRILGFTAGVVLGVIAFDLLPEIFELTHEHSISPRLPMAALVIGFMTLHVIEKLIIIHSAHEDEYSGHSHVHPKLGIVSASVLVAHSFLDGVGIGLAFQVNNAVGLAVAAAVIAHDFADGMNTAGLLLRHGNGTRKVKRFILLDAVAPVLGAASTQLFTLSAAGIVLYLGLFSGVLLYIGAADILPEAHAKHSSRGTLLLTIAGAGLMFLVSGLL